MRYSRGTLNYLERITLSDLTQMMNMTDLIAIGVETLRINYECSLEKEFTELTRINPSMLIILDFQSSLFMSQLCFGHLT